MDRGFLFLRKSVNLKDNLRPTWVAQNKESNFGTKEIGREQTAREQAGPDAEAKIWELRKYDRIIVDWNHFVSWDHKEIFPWAQTQEILVRQHLFR